MKYKLINSVTKKETICDKVTIDGFDYYVSDEPSLFKDGQTFLSKENIIHTNYGYNYGDKVIIATNNLNIDIPKVVREFVSFEGAKDLSSFVRGYNKSQETHPFSAEDMIDFGEWKDFNFYQHIQDNLYKTMQARPMYKVLENKSYTLKELLQLWQEQQPKKVYYEN